MAVEVGFGDGELVELAIGAAVAGARDTTISVSEGSGKGVLVGRVLRAGLQAARLTTSSQASRAGGVRMVSWAEILSTGDTDATDKCFDF